MTDAGVDESGAELMVASKSFANRRLRPIHEEPSPRPSAAAEHRSRSDRDFAHDLDRDQRSLCDLLTAYPPSAKTRWMNGEMLRESQKRSAAVASLDARRMRARVYSLSTFNRFDSAH